MNSADEPRAPDSRRDAEPDPATLSVRGEIQQFFGVKGSEARDRGRDRAGFDRLLADLEKRIVGSMRETQTPPPEIGPFILEERIGRGGFAVVYRATHKRTGARAAVKLVPAADLSSQRRIATEVESLIRLRHPNIVRVIDTGEDAGWAWVATDLIPGITLADFIRTKRSPGPSFQIGDDPAGNRDDPDGGRPRTADSATVRLAITWFRDLAGALDALHSAGLVHRDVKPANILIDSEQRPFLIDFGLSSSAETTVDGILAGTVPYMSPEQTLGGWVAITPKSDIYSLAATFHEVLTGQRVTHGAARDAMLQEIAFVPVAPPSRVARGVPSALDPIFVRALSKDANQRFASAHDLVEDLDCWLGGRALVHVKEAAGVRFRRFARRHAIPLTMGAILVLAGLGWVTASYLSRERAYRDVLEKIRTSLDGGDPLNALSMLASNAGRYRERNDFVHTYREAVRTGGEPFAREMLKGQAFSSASLAFKAAHRRFADEARVHLETTGIEDPHLILVVALSKSLSFDHAGAKAELDRHRDVVDRSRILTEMEGIVSLDRLDEKAYDKVLARLKRLPPSQPNTAEAGIRTFRVLNCNYRFPSRRVSRAEMDAAERDLQFLLKGSDQAFVRMMLTLLAIDRRDYVVAQAHLDALSNLQGGIADEAATMVINAAVKLIRAGETSGDEKALLLETGTSLAKRALEIDRSHVKRFLHELSHARLPIRLLWIDVALDETWARRPVIDEELFAFVAHALKDPAFDDLASIIRLARLARSQPGFEALHRRDEATWISFHRLYLWALRAERAQLNHREKRDEARALASEARETIGRLGFRPDAVPYPFMAEDALAAAALASSEPDQTKAADSLKDAATLLRNVTDPGVLAGAQQRVGAREERDDLAKLSAECVQELSAVEAAIEGRAESR